MTANEMRNLFKQLYDGAVAVEMGFDDTEVSRFLNLAQTLIINEKIFAFRNSQLEGFEIGSKRDNELNTLKRSLTLWYQESIGEWLYRDYNNILNLDINVIQDKVMNYNAVIFPIPNDILYIVNDTGDILINKTLYRNIPIKNINEDNINDIIRNPFMKPDITVLYRESQTLQNIEDNELNLYRTVKLFIPENSEFKRWNVTFIKRPLNIVVDIFNPDNQINCELDDLVHNDIVFKAVELALGAIGSEKFQIGTYNTNKNVN